jgi:hypothetical protein
MDWLPKLICCDGNWDEVEHGLYAKFKSDFLDRQASFKGLAVKLRFIEGDPEKRIPFWHLISECGEGDSEEERIPDFRRCERIGWIRAIVDHANDPNLMIWEQQRNGKINIAVALPDFSYVVFLASRKPKTGPVYVILLTAYFVQREKKREKYRREYEEFQARKGA